MSDLLDSHVLLVLVSAATVWELSLKHHQGKLPELEQLVLLAAFPCHTLW